MIGLVSTPAHAQAVDTQNLQNMQVEQVLERAQQWKVPILLVANLLLIALLFAGGLLKPGGFDKAGMRDVKPLPTMIWVFSALVIYLAWGSASEIVSMSSWLSAEEPETVAGAAKRDMVAVALGAVAALGMLHIVHKSAPDAGLRLHPLDFAVGLGCFMLAYPFIELVSVCGLYLHDWTVGGEPTAIAHPTLERIVGNLQNSWTWVTVGVVVIGVPIVEEIIWRVFVQSGLLRATGTPWVAIVFTGIIFAMFHRLAANPVPWHAMPAILALGIACGVAYERTKRVGVPIAMHMIFNGVNVALAILIAPEAVETGVG